MKTKVTYIITFLLAVHLSTAQILFQDNFNSHAVGEVSTDPTGATPGKGGWYVKKNLPPYTFPVEIVPEAGRGNVLSIGSNLNSHNGLGNEALLTQKNFNTLWNNRTAGNNILKLEYDIFLIGNNQSIIQSVVGLRTLGNLWTTRIFMENYNKNNQGHISTTNAYLYALYYDIQVPQTKDIFLGTNNTSEYNNFPYNTWLSVQLFIDYKYEAGNITGGTLYVYIPALSVLKKADFTHSEVIELLAITGGGRGNLQTVVKYDNVKLTALNTLPAYLAVEDYISSKFNLYPNPATNIVNITNNENMLVQQVTVYDIAGKQLSSQNYNNETEIQLNVENLASGTYLLYLQTNQGTAVKKLVKK